MTPEAFRLRWHLCAGLLALPLLGVVARAGYLQVGASARMLDMAEDQYLQDVTLTAPRGNIVDRAGRPLAVSLKVPSVFAEPRHVEDPERTAALLAPLVKEKASVLRKKLESGRAFYWLARRIGPDAAEKVRKLRLPGIGISEEGRRFYPNREMAAHVLGYTNLDGQGLEGLERVYEERLAGKQLQVDGVRDARGARLLMGDFAPTENLVGDEVVLTLDSQIQFITEQALARAVLQHGAAAGFAIVMDPSSGDVLALANQPTFNPNEVNKAAPNARRNRAVSDAFEPGSTMKSLLLASAFEHHITTPDERIFCENGVFHVGRHKIRDTHKAEWLTVEDVLAHSSNIGALKIGTRLGRQRWGEALHQWGFGKRTGLGLMGETPGIMSSPDRWSDAALATISFGQGISVSGIQMANAVAALANQGVMMTPRVVRSIRSADGRVEEVPTREVGRVVSAESARKVIKAMEKVPGKEGTAPLAAVPGVLVAGKTGTAQKVDPGTRGYGQGRIASFVGLAPSQEPKLLIYVVIDEPQDSPYGGIVAAPAFREIAMGALPLLGVSVLEEPRKEDPPPAAISEETLSAARALASRLAAEGAASADGIDDAALDEAPEGAVPDFAGMNVRVAIKEALKVGLDPVVQGSGLVVSQKPKAGKPLKGERVVRLTLGRTGRDG